jgi:NAD+ kinase
MKILLFGRYIKEANFASVKKVIEEGSKRNIKLYANNNVHDHLEQIIGPHDIERISSHTELDQASVDFVMTLGGDGTILEATTMIRHLGVPVVGVNLGRLGFLASVEERHISLSFDQLEQNQYTIEPRTMIYLESSPSIFNKTNFALNDFTLHKRDTSSMITIHTYINGDYLNSYWADGLIVSTPTGSTGYSLSCGGPIVFPNSGNFIITPVAPHNLNVRPLVISDNSVISFEIEGRSENFLCTLDSRFETITSEHQLAVRKCDFNTELVVLKNISFLKTIHEKLSWGADSRN